MRWKSQGRRTALLIGAGVDFFLPGFFIAAVTVASEGVIGEMGEDYMMVVPIVALQRCASQD